MADQGPSEPDKLFREKVLAARKMSSDERVPTGLRMFEEERERFRAQMRRKHPEWSAEQIDFVLRARITEQRRIDDAGVYLSFP